jgi:hypothetical protein
MSSQRIESIEAGWSRLGVLLPVASAKESPDLERLLLESARQLPANARLFPIVASWLAEFGGFVAKHRLGRLITSELETLHQPALGLLLETAIQLGAPKDLSQAVQACRPPRSPPRSSGPTSEARTWRHWPSETPPHSRGNGASGRRESNPSGMPFAPRIGCSGTTGASASGSSARATCAAASWSRCGSIPTGTVRSEADLARLSGATRAAVRKSVAALIQEGEIRFVESPADARSRGIALRSAA